jgi:fumarate reductase flavoprotein subunit
VNGKYEADVLVLGGGLSGITTALTAAESGLSVIIIEKTDSLQGNVVLSTGSFVFAGTDLQEAAGIDDGPAELRDDLLKVGGGFADPALVDIFIEEQLPTYNWLREIGVEFKSVTLSSNQSRPRSHSGDVHEYMDRIVALVQANPHITVLTEHAAKELVVADSRVVGATVHARDEEITLRASRGVVLATGGFGWNKRIIATFAPRFINSIPLGNPACLGDGLYMAMALGADVADMGFITGTFGTSAPIEGGPVEPILLIAMYRGAIVVDRTGRRFVDESISYKTIADVSLAQGGGAAFQVFDRKVMDQTNPMKSANDFEGALAKGYMYSADSLEELAEKMGFETHAFLETVARYNAAIAGDVPDEFGRTSLAAGWGEITPLDEPPFYAYPSTVGLPSTYGGVRVDHEMRVLNVFGRPIEGLYAAGEVVGGFHGQGYISGTSLSKSAVFGRIAGDAIARTHERVQI